MNQANNADTKAALRKLTRFVLSIAAMLGILGSLFHAIAVFQISTAIAGTGAGVGVLFQAIFAFVLSFLVIAFVAAVNLMVLLALVVVFFAIFGKKNVTDRAAGSGSSADTDSSDATGPDSLGE